MKKLLLTLTLFVTTIAFGQNKITLTVNGLTDEINAALQPGEYIKSLNRLDDKKFVFYAKVQNTAGGTSKYVKIKNTVEPNDAGKYDFSIQFDVDKKGSLDFSKEITVTIEGETTFGNDVWLEKNVQPADFDKPLWIDNYGNKFRSYEAPKSIMKLTIVGPKKTDSIGKVITAEGDETRTLKFEDFHLQLKNVGSDSWVINDSPVQGSIVAGRTLEYKLDPKNSKIDVNKPVVLHACARTLNGGYIWRELTLQPWEMGGDYKLGKNYSKELVCDMPGEGAAADTDDEVEAGEDTLTQEDEPAGEETATEPVKEESNEREVSISKPSTVVNPTKCVTDSLTKQLQLSGGKLCVKGIKLSRGTTNSATLLFDSEYTLEGVAYPLQGSQAITYDNQKSYLLSATLSEGITVDLPIGKLDLTPNHIVEFSQKGLYAAKLVKDANIEFNGQQLICKSTAKEFDIEFDKLGKLRSFTLGADASWSITTSELTLPANSYLSFKKGYLYRVAPVASTEVKIGEQTFSVVPKKKRPSMEFSAANVLESFVIGGGHTTVVDGKEVSIQSESEVELNHTDAGYSIKSVVVASPITMDVHKGSKVKTVDVKAGKRLIIENGKVVKVK